MANLPQHVTTRQMAAALNCSARTVQRMASSGEIPAVKVRHEYRYDPREVTLALSRSGAKRA